MRTDKTTKPKPLTKSWWRTPPDESDLFGVNLRRSFQTFARIGKKPAPGKPSASAPKRNDLESLLAKLDTAARTGKGVALTADEARVAYYNFKIILRS